VERTVERILVPVDGPKGSLKAARFVAKLARDRSASLLLVRVYDAPAAANLGLTAVSGEELQAAKDRLSEEHFLAARSEIGATEIGIHDLPEIGDPARCSSSARRTRTSIWWSWGRAGCPRCASCSSAARPIRLCEPVPDQ
jgi:nucleotide-binding universal stress UspA family protein